MPGWTPNKGKPITGWTGHPRMHPPNQRFGKLDKLSHNACDPDRLSQGAMRSTLNKRGFKGPNPWTSRTLLRRVPKDRWSCKDTSRHHCRRVGKRHKA